MNEVLSFEIPVPPLAALEGLKKSLLHEAFSGEL
jgi:hypothetical protein